MSKHSGSRSDSRPTWYVVTTLLGAVLGGAAWFYLVRAAIDFGVVARSGGSIAAWGFMLAAALGATVCLLLVLGLVGRALTAVGLISDYKPKRAGARRRER